MSKKKYSREEALIEVAKRLSGKHPETGEVIQLAMDRVALDHDLLDSMTGSEEISPENVYNVSVTFIKSKMPDGRNCLKIVDQSVAVVGQSPFPPLHEMLDPEEAHEAEEELIGIMLSGNCGAGDRMRREKERDAKKAENLAKNSPADKSEEIH